MRLSAGAGAATGPPIVRHRSSSLFTGGVIVFLGLVGILGMHGRGIFRRPLVRVAYNHFPPYLDEGPHGIPVGFAADIFAQAARQAKVDIQWVKIEGSADQAFSEGKADLYPLMTVTPERESRFYMSAPWWENQFALITTRGREIHDAAGATGKVIATRAGVIQALSVRLYPGARLIEMGTMEEMEEALCDKRVDGFFSDMRLLQALLMQRTTGCAGQTLYAVSVPDSRLFLGTGSTKAAAFANDRIFREIAKLALDGTLSRTAANFGIFMPYDTARLKRVVDAERHENQMAWGLVATLVILFLSVIQTNMVRRSRRVAEAAQAEAREMQDRFSEFMKHTPTIAFIKNEHRKVVYSNEEFWDRQGAVANWSLSGGEEGSIGQKLCLRDEEVLEFGRTVEVTETLDDPAGISRHFLVLKFPFQGGAGTRLLGGIGLDVTARLKAEKELEYQAKSDLLTGLPNRRSFMQVLETALAKGYPRKERIAVGFIDLDGFKRVNDSMGHEAGDDLLKLVAARLNQVGRESGIIARLGGDEFTFFLAEGFPNEIERTTTAMLRAFNAPFRVGGREIVISASFGVSLFPDHGNTATQLLRNADAAMYLAKQNGKGRIEFWSGPRGVEENIAEETDWGALSASHPLALALNGATDVSLRPL
jgi:diguanylate cyclase (GGDEF)-like protein